MNTMEKLVENIEKLNERSEKNMDEEQIRELKHLNDDDLIDKSDFNEFIDSMIEKGKSFDEIQNRVYKINWLGFIFKLGHLFMVLLIIIVSILNIAYRIDVFYLLYIFVFVFYILIYIKVHKLIN